MRRYFISLIAVLAPFTFLTSISGVSNAATKQVKQYQLTARHCKAAYYGVAKTHKVKGKTTKYVECILTSKHSIKLDPSFVQNPANPLDTTWAFSAAASDGNQVAAGQLPAGVLRFTVENSAGWTHTCVANVGGAQGDGTCEVIVPTTGTYTDIVEYDSGTVSTSETETHVINPYATSTVVSVQNGQLVTTVTDQNGNVLPVPATDIHYMFVGYPNYSVPGSFNSFAWVNGNAQNPYQVPELGGTGSTIPGGTSNPTVIPSYQLYAVWGVPSKTDPAAAPAGYTSQPSDPITLNAPTK